VGDRERDEYLDRVLIGGREKREVVIADYDSSWPSRFQHERERILRALGAAALRVEHIGSTAVPGLAAKPVIDVLVTVNDPDDEATLQSAFESAGYELRVREPGHRMFRTSRRDVHVHIWADADPEVDRYLAFRDRLRRSLEDRAVYEQLKRELATREWSDINEYADAKSNLIAAIITRADTPSGLTRLPE
jgi:GrpB-like predicted nucleotidyltransferase (UPF0157 family)